MFDSGWEYGYWLNNVVTARALWDPMLSVSHDEAFARILQPVARALGNPAWVPHLGQWAAKQKHLLIDGAKAISSDHFVHGMAYLQVGRDEPRRFRCFWRWGEQI